MSKISYAGYRFPPEIIHQSIWLYLRFTLSSRTGAVTLTDDSGFWGNLGA